MSTGKCGVNGCGRDAARKVSYLDAKVLEEHGLLLHPVDAAPPRRPGHVYLCEEHYKLWRKLTKRERLLRDLSRKVE